MIDIYEYNDFRRFVREWIGQNPIHTGRALASKAGISPAQISLMLNGKRTCSAEVGRRLASAMDLEENEQVFFGQLVTFSESSNRDAQAKSLRQMGAMRRWENRSDSIDDHARLHDDWLNFAVMELVEFDGFQADPAWIASVIRPRVDKTRCAQSLETLVSLGMLVVHKDGSATPNPQMMNLGRGWPSAASVAMHRSNVVAHLELSKEVLDIVPLQNRQFNSITFKGNNDTLRVLRARVSQCVRDMAAAIDASDKPRDTIFVMNLQLFPLTKEPTDA